MDDSHIDADAATAAHPHGLPTILLADLARGVVVAVAPEELELFAIVSDRWAAGLMPGRRRGPRGGSIGSGISAALTSELVYPLLIGALSPLLGNTVAAGWQRQRRWWRRRRPKPRPSLPSATVTIDVAQLEAVREACITYGATLGLSKAKATVLAEAVYGVLRQTADSGDDAVPKP